MRPPKTLCAFLLLCAASARPLHAQPPTTLTLTFADEVPTLGTVGGTCFEDTNSNNEFDPSSDRPLPNIAVSDGVEVVLSGVDGTYQLPVGTTQKLVFITPPATHRPARSFFQPIRLNDPSTTTPQRYDFALVPQPPAPGTFSFAHITDVQAAGEADLQRLSHALTEVAGQSPAPRFIVATGDHVDSATRTSLFQGVAATYANSGLPVYAVPGTYDLLPQKEALSAYHNHLGPDYYSVDFADWHFVFLNSTATAPHQMRWLERDLKQVGAGKKLMAFQYHVPSGSQIAQLQQLGFRAIFSGQWHGTRLEVDKRGLATITQSPLLMGGLDGSPASYRLVHLHGDQLNTEVRVLGVAPSAAIVCPDENMNGGRRLIVNLVNSRGGVKEARFRLQAPGAPPFAQGGLAQISSTSWMAPLDERTGTPDTLPPSFVIRVRATSHTGEQWETSRSVTVAQLSAPPKPAADWPLFMGSAQRNGRAAADLAPPLKLAWVAPTHGIIAIGSPVLYKGNLAIGTRDTDNLLNNAVGIFDAVTGQRKHMVKTDTMINHSPAFAEDKEDGPGSIWATAAGGDVLQIDPASGKMQGSGGLGRASWLHSSPAVQGRLAVLGNSAFLQGFHSQVGEHRWTSPGTGDWPPSFASPTLAGPTLLMGGNWLKREGKPASVYGLDAENGRLRWSIETTGISGSVAVAGGRAYFIDNQGTLVSVEAETGKPLARKPLDGGWSLSTPALDKDVVVAPGGAGTVFAFHTQTMEPLWKFSAGDSLWTLAPFRKDRKAIFSSPTITANHVYLGCSDGKLYCLDKMTGQPRWSFDFGVPTLSTPCVSGNAVYTASMDGNVYCFTGGQP